MRGWHERHTKSPDEQLHVRSHIRSFPMMDPHYSRSDTSRQFHGSDLNIGKMHHLYVEVCKAKELPHVKVGVYRRVFCSEFNLSFHRPKKDVCQKCEHYENASAVDKGVLQDDYRIHIMNKNEARREKETDKQSAKQTDSTWHAITMDLQSVLATPCGNVSALYYARKLAVYNFTIYNQAIGDGYCMLWNETQGRRGANEIGSLLYLYLRDYVKPHVKHVTIPSDSTVSQNRNQYIAALLLLAVQCLPVIETIEQKFLEPGHTEMEVDSMHSSIDSSRKHLKISSPYEWPVVIQMARRQHPYQIREVSRSDFLDLHNLVKTVPAESGLKRISWMKVKCVRYTKGTESEIEVKEQYSEPYKTIKLHKGCRITRSSRKSKQQSSTSCLFVC